MTSIIIYTDGGARPNPGHGGAGFVVYSNDTELHRAGVYLGSQETNNTAEYKAVLLALNYVRLHHKKYDKVLIFTDSNLLVQQFAGRWKCKHAGLRPLLLQLSDLKKKFKSLEIRWVKGHDKSKGNIIADALATKAIATGIIS